MNDANKFLDYIGSFPIQSFIENVPTYCVQNNINDIILRGDKNYIVSALAEPMEQQIQLAYNNRPKINIEIMEA